MYVCVCHGITDSQIRAAVDAGACSAAAVERELGCGASCGRCSEMTRDLVGQRRQELAAARPPAEPPQARVSPVL